MNIDEKKEWSKLTPYQHTRKRTETTFGSRQPRTSLTIEYDDLGARLVSSTWTPAVFTAFREIVDNALDEVVVHGHGDTIHVNYDTKNMIFSVTDNGRGIPINWDEEEKSYAATVLLSHTLSGRNFDDESRENTRGLNGIGAKGVNFTSEFFEVEVYRNGTFFNQRFSEGDNEHIIEEPLIFPAKEKKSGTTIRFKLSNIVFENIILPEYFINARMHEIAICNPKLKLFYNGNKVSPKKIETLFPNSISFDIIKDTFRADVFVVDQGHTEYFMYGVVNSIPVFDGGEHEDAFKKYFTPGLIKALSRESSKRKLEINNRDITDGMLVYMIIDMKAPFFDNQAKTRLTSQEVDKYFKEDLTPDFFKKLISKSPEWIEKIYDRCAQRTSSKESAEVTKLAKQARKVRIEELEDACGKNRSECMLFLAEGKCLHEDTEIKIFHEINKITHVAVDKKIKDLTVGDKVLTHLGNYKLITNKWKTQKESFVIKTNIGDIICSSEHKFLIYNNSYQWKTLSNIDIKHDSLVKYNKFGRILIKILDITKGPIVNMVDISVEDDESFVLSNGIVSHNSAISGLVAARNPDIHGGLPLRGKPMNVREVTAAVAMKNEVLSRIMASIGLVPNTRVNRHMLRYGKILITTDADEDGKNIAGLLVNFFYTFWKELFDPDKEPMVYIFDTPLIIAVKGKQRKYWYNEDYHKFNPDDYKGWEITRAKGLAALKKEDWKVILENPKLIPIVDDGNMETALTLLFSKTTRDERKEWIGM